jgi:hypothetical protein
MPLKEMKVGFERLGMVAFVAVAAIFGLIYLVANEPYVVPDPETERGRAIAKDIARECDSESLVFMGRLCRERVSARYRWRHYVDGMGEGKTTVILTILAVAGGLFGIWAIRWVYEGFTED